jgi:ATPase family associated with various cellular activities (AAA)
MPTSPPNDWSDANQAALLASLSAIKRRLAQYAEGKSAPQPADPKGAADAGQPAALDRLVTAFGLSPFERDMLLLCTGMELDGEFPALCAAAQADPTRPYPTFGLALAALEDAHWSAFTATAPLRHWRLIEVGTGAVLTRATLRIDERILHFLVGIGQLDERLAVLLDVLPVVAAESLVPSQSVVAEQVADIWSDVPRGPELPVVQLCGTAADCRPVAAAAAALLCLRTARLATERLPATAADLDSLLRLWEREAVLSGLGVLLLDSDDEVPSDSDAGRARSAAIARLLERAAGPVILREREPRRLSNRHATILDVGHPLAAEQLGAWRQALGDAIPDQTALAAATAQFSLTLTGIRAIAGEVRAHADTSPPPDLAAKVWDLCRRRLRGALDGLAQRIESDLHWDDLVLPDPQKDVLHAIAAQLRQRTTVHDTWGFAQKSRRGLGISALFHGQSGTGKTMAAEVLASELRLDLYHIDLSRIVSKYIGETEGNLRRVFDAAEENGAILLFDEADSLFGTRSEVKDSHDRYANIEVSYLLQRMEAYRGLAILTTNMRAALDPAFMRRLRFALPFQFPDEPQRAAIWRRVFPKSTPLDKVDPDRLSRLRIAGGNIRNIALNAAFLAADAGKPVQMGHIRDATRAEYVKLERRLTAAESEAWA